MADTVLAEVIQKAAELAGNLIVTEVSNLNQLEEGVRWIETEMKRIQAFLKDIAAVQEERQGVETLISEILDLADDVDDIMAMYFPQLESQHKRKGFLGYLKSAACIFSRCYVAHNFVTEIEKIKTRVKDIERARKTYEIPESEGNNGRDTWDPRRSFPHVEEPNVVGFETHIQELEGKLLRTDLQHGVIAIIGMPGLGKTTLAKKVYKSVQGKFQCSAWVFVSQKPIIKDLFQDIARQVGLEESQRKEGVEANLSNFLLGKKYFIVIDDIWESHPWDALSIGIPINSKNGSRIILTSRRGDVITDIGRQSSLHVHELLPLDHERSKELFFKMVMVPPQSSGVTSDPEELENVGLQIVDKCGGVPLAIVVTTGLLLWKERTTQAWREVFSKLGRNHEQISKTLALSYKDLPTDLKRCFLYFGHFPEDCEISAFELINLWAGEGFIKAREQQEVEDVGKDYLNNLIARNLIQVVKRRFDGSVRSCRIHDLLHSLCISESEKINFLNTLDNVSSSPSMRVRRVSICGDNIKEYISLNHQTPNPKLRTLLSFNMGIKLERKQLKIFLGDLRFLRVLKVEIEFLSRLPKEIGLGSIRCPTSIWRMKQLRHIYGVILTQGPRAKEVSLPNVQTLFVKNHIEDLKLYWLCGFPNLRKLRIGTLGHTASQIIEVLSDATITWSKLENLQLDCYSPAWQGRKSLTNLSHYPNVCKLRLSGHCWKLPKADVLPPNLAMLTLKRYPFEEDEFETMRKLPRLRILKLSHCEPMKKMVCSGGSSANNFPQLQVLEIERMYGCEELIMEEGGMPRLNKLSIRNCPFLRISHNLKNIMILSS
ncbi:hypothetical protein F0562_034381 [Nyssa sinensis]|uniref:AAA+ ATPase domain-containing protein n=1 Tax=Nyssa sinensis TaxID=561372 RepID=A0A5J5AGY3_9ASTE|nr:hypothetical protein F0562_034381 [Nyssa sinensis]